MGGLQLGTSGDQIVSAGDHMGHFYGTAEEEISVLVSSLIEYLIVAEEGSELALFPEADKQRGEREDLLMALRSDWNVGGREVPPNFSGSSRPLSIRVS